MPDTSPNFLNYSTGRIRDYFEYRKFLNQAVSGRKAKRDYKNRASRFFGYPENHNYSFFENRLIPSFKLYSRYRKIRALYPDMLTSLLDISSCRGFYVMDASMNMGIDRSVGIDIVDSFISESNAIKMFVNDEKAAFSVSNLEDLHKSILDSNEPYQTVIFTGSYHYFYWGSAEDETAYLSHDAILKILSDITTDRVIFSGRMELSQLARYPKSKALTHPERDEYTARKFLECAEKYFRVTTHGFLGRSRLLVLHKL